MKALNASALICRTFDSVILKSLYTVRSKDATPGPYVSVVGVLPIPSEFAGGSVKLAGLNLYQRLGSAVEPTDVGVALLSSHSDPVCWQRNGMPPVGVPVQ